MAGVGRGRIVEFDVRRGLGVVEGDDGSRLGFHCTQAVDPSCPLDVGTVVRYEIRPGGLGAWEATAIEVV